MHAVSVQQRGAVRIAAPAPRAISRLSVKACAVPDKKSNMAAAMAATVTALVLLGTPVKALADTAAPSKPIDETEIKKIICAGNPTAQICSKNSFSEPAK